MQQFVTLFVMFIIQWQKVEFRANAGPLYVERTLSKVFIRLKRLWFVELFVFNHSSLITKKGFEVQKQYRLIWSKVSDPKNLTNVKDHRLRNVIESTVHRCSIEWLVRKRSVLNSTNLLFQCVIFLRTLSEQGSYIYGSHIIL